MADLRDKIIAVFIELGFGIDDGILSIAVRDVWADCERIISFKVIQNGADCIVVETTPDLTLREKFDITEKRFSRARLVDLLDSHSRTFAVYFDDIIYKEEYVALEKKYAALEKKYAELEKKK